MHLMHLVHWTQIYSSPNEQCESKYFCLGFLWPYLTQILSTLSVIVWACILSFFVCFQPKQERLGMWVCSDIWSFVHWIVVFVCFLLLFWEDSLSLLLLVCLYVAWVVWITWAALRFKDGFVALDWVKIKKVANSGAKHQVHHIGLSENQESGE